MIESDPLSIAATPPVTTTAHLSFTTPLTVTRATDLTRPPFDADTA